ncbi:MAG TPA: hypothetical protein VIT91_09720 [Chthoniobacterales bacterium]
MPKDAWTQRGALGGDEEFFHSPATWMAAEQDRAHMKQVFAQPGGAAAAGWLAGSVGRLGGWPRAVTAGEQGT